MSLRPTVIGASTPAAAGPPAPTVMPASAPASAPLAGPVARPFDGVAPMPASASALTSRRPPVPPTALPTAVSAPSSPAAASLRPTQITRAASTLAASHPAVPVPPSNPVTKVLGVERQGLRVDTTALAQRHAGASAAAVDQAAALLAGVVPGHHPPAAIEQLGRAAQEGVARLVERALRIADDEAPRTAHRHTARLLELLGELADVLRPSSGVGWWRKPLRRTLAERRPEIDALRGLLAQAEAALIDRREKLLALQDDAGRLLDGLNGSLIAVSELRPVFDDARRLDGLDGREIELARSVALLESHRLQVQRLAADVTLLAQRIRDAVLHALPAWLSVVAALPDDGLNDTQRYTLSDQLQALMRGLSSPRA